MYKIINIAKVLSVREHKLLRELENDCPLICQIGTVIENNKIASGCNCKMATNKHLIILLCTVHTLDI